jgi:hypothetical protein
MALDGLRQALGEPYTIERELVVANGHGAWRPSPCAPIPAAANRRVGARLALQQTDSAADRR